MTDTTDAQNLAAALNAYYPAAPAERSSSWGRSLPPRASG